MQETSTAAAAVASPVSTFHRAAAHHVVLVFSLCGVIPVAASLILGPGRFSGASGATFSLACALAAYLTQSRHKLRLRHFETAFAVALGAVGQPLVSLVMLPIFLATHTLPRRHQISLREDFGFLVGTALASALCALLAAGAAAIWSRRIHPGVLAAMLIVALLWPLTLLLHDVAAGTALGERLVPMGVFLLVPFGPLMTLTWHVPMAALTGLWLASPRRTVLAPRAAP